MAEKKLTAKELKEKLCYEPKNSAQVMSEKEIEKAYLFCEGYKTFLNLSKTEREAVDTTISMARERGYKAFEANKKYNTGDKVFHNICGKAIILCTIGEAPLSEGVRIVASHIDSPRIDLKQRPLYEEAQIAMFKTHYYGGIKKYQWTAIPLALHGVVVREDGEKVFVTIGEDEGDPVFTISDILPHLAATQMERKASEIIKGEELNVLVGSRMFKDDDASEKVKLAILNILFEKYGMIEADFLSAELSLVPAFKATDVGFDRSLLGSYGHDDRSCAYPSLIAEMECKKPKYTSVTVLADKEETGSNGNTGLNSHFLEFFIEDLAAPHGIAARTVFNNSLCLSADVNAAFDATFPEPFEKNNSAYLNYGVVVTKYTGSRGKGGTNDATAEMVGTIRAMLNKAKVQWQTGNLGKVDAGGGGTVAMYISALGVNTIDIGVPVLSMHAPFEVVSKTDVFQTYKAFETFLK